MPLSDLPRVWWFPASPALPRPDSPELATYYGFDLDAQPAVLRVDPDLAWLADEPLVREWAVGSREATQRSLATDELALLLGSVEPPAALAVLAARPELQRKLRSYTACYFDLGDIAVPCSEGGVLLHFLSDQQWVRHWLVLVQPDGSAPVVSTTLPVGFERPEDWEGTEQRPPEDVALNGSLDLTLSSESLEEFFYRFWIENEIAFRADQQPLPDPFRLYVEELREGA